MLIIKEAGRGIVAVGDNFEILLDNFLKRADADPFLGDKALVVQDVDKKTMLTSPKQILLEDLVRLAYEGEAVINVSIALHGHPELTAHIL